MSVRILLVIVIVLRTKTLSWHVPWGTATKRDSTGAMTRGSRREFKHFPPALTRYYSVGRFPTNKRTPWSRDLPQNLRVPHGVKKFPAFYVTASFIAVFTTATYLSSSWARLIQSMLPQSHFSITYFNIILPSTSRSSKWFLTSGFLTRTLYSPFLSPICATSKESVPGPGCWE